MLPNGCGSTSSEISTKSNAAVGKSEVRGRGARVFSTKSGPFCHVLVVLPAWPWLHVVTDRGGDALDIAAEALDR